MGYVEVSLIYCACAIAVLHVIVYLLRRRRGLLRAFGYIVLVAAFLAMLGYARDFRRMSASVELGVAKDRYTSYAGLALEIVASSQMRNERFGADGDWEDTPEQQSRKAQHAALAGELEELLRVLSSTSPLSWPKPEEVLQDREGDYASILDDRKAIRRLLSHVWEDVDEYTKVEGDSRLKDWEVALLFLAPFLVGTAVAAGSVLVTASIKRWI